MGCDKALIEIEGKPLLTRAVEFCNLFCDEVLISSDSELHRIEGFQTIADQFKDCGPMGGIYSCISASANDWNFVLSVDAPFVRQEFVLEMLANCNNYDAVIPIHDRKKEPLIAFYNKSVLPELETLLKEGNYKMHSLIERVRTNFADAETYLKQSPNMFHNLNFPEDIQE